MNALSTASPSPLRLAYLTNIPSPYRAAMVRVWAQANPEILISVFYTDLDDQGRGWAADPIGGDVRETRLPILASIKKYGKLNRHLATMVRDHDIVMVGGFEQASYLVAALLARRAGKPVILLFDGFSPARFGNEPRSILALKRFTARLVDAFFANGRVGEAYLREQLGVPVNRPVYNQFLSHRGEFVKDARQIFAGMDKQQVRATLGIPAEGRIAMVCGYLIERKRIDLLIDAVAGLPEAVRPMLLVVGDGHLAEPLRIRAERAGIATHFAGFRSGTDLAAYYLAADLFVLSSSDDPWGLVVNEAMDAGLPVLVSDACGAALDLVQDGINGFVFRSGDVADLSTKLEHALAADLSALGVASQGIISDWTSTQSAENLGRVVTAVQTHVSAAEGKS